MFSRSSIVENPKYQTIEEIKKQYNGFCVYIVRCRGSEFKPLGGEVVAYNKSLADLVIEADSFGDDPSLGIVTTKTYTGFGDSGVIQVVNVND